MHATNRAAITITPYTVRYEYGEPKVFRRARYVVAEPIGIDGVRYEPAEAETVLAERFPEGNVAGLLVPWTMRRE